jgi:biopolymer transport protein ExbD
MPRRRGERAKAEIETGSFSDISFLLIIFFVLTTTFEKAVGRIVDIPSAAPPERQVQEEEKKTPTVNVMADRILFGMGENENAGDPVSLAELKSRLLELALPAKPENDRIVIVELAEDVVWDRYFKVVTTVAEAGGVVAIMEEEQ